MTQSTPTTLRVRNPYFQRALTTKGITLPELAEHTGVSLKLLQYYATGWTYPRHSVQKELADHLDITPQE